MRVALREARLAGEAGEVPIGAAVVCGGRLLGLGRNAVEQLTDVTAHAEMLALTAAEQQLGAKYLPEATLFVTLEPCPMCAAALNAAQLGRVVWAADDPRFGARRFQPSLFHKRTLIVRGLLDYEAEALLQNFFKYIRK